MGITALTPGYKSGVLVSERTTGLEMLIYLTQLVWQFVAEHGQRRGQSRAPGEWEGGADGQAVCKVMNAVTDCNHIREQALLWMGGERKSEAHVVIYAALPISTIELLT